MAEKTLQEYEAYIKSCINLKSFLCGLEDSGFTLDSIVDLCGADLMDADLHGANLRGAYLADANLVDANLRGADLRGVNLCGADLMDADLMYANLRGANLRGANLFGANLRGADLTDAYLIGANLSVSDLMDANLHDARMKGASLGRSKNIASFGPMPTSGRMIYAVNHSGKIMIQAGCFWGTIDELIEAVNESHGDKTYLAVCEILKSWKFNGFYKD